MELGFRYDRVSYTKERHFSPRFNMVFALGSRTTLRSGWGHYYQSQGIHQLQVQDGEYTFFPAGHAEHRVIGFEHLFYGGIHFRIEGYYKKYSDQRPEYRNWEQRIDMFPEMLYDRFKLLFDGSTSKGIELFLKKVSPGKFSWWASYTLASVQDRITKIINKDEEKSYNEKFPSIFDQRHTFRIDIKYRPTSSWQLNLAWQYHTGCPYTELVYSPLLNKKTEMGDYNENRYPAYQRLDLRINRNFTTSKGRITAFLEIMNLYNRKNVAYYDYTLTYDPNQRPHEVLVKNPKHWFALLPSFGINVSWN